MGFRRVLDSMGCLHGGGWQVGRQEGRKKTWEKEPEEPDPGSFPIYHGIVGTMSKDDSPSRQLPIPAGEQGQKGRPAIVCSISAYGPPLFSRLEGM